MSDQTEATALLERMLANPVRFIQRLDRPGEALGGERYARQIALLRVQVDQPAFCQYPSCGTLQLYSCLGCVRRASE